MKAILGIEIKGLKEQLKPKLNDNKEELGIGAVHLENPVIKELVKARDKVEGILINK